jgi:predicted secreted protein
VILELDEVPTTGYRWRVSGMPDEVTLVGERFDAASSAAGGGGARRFTFRIGAPGTYMLTFQRARPWETRPLEERRFEVVVADL